MASWSSSTIKEHSEGINFEVALDLWLHGLLNLNRSTRCPRVWVSPNVHLSFMIPFVLVVMLLNHLLSTAVSSQHDLLSKGAEGVSKRVTSLMRHAVPRYLNRTSRAGLVTVTKFSQQFGWWLPVKSVVIRQIWGWAKKSSQQGRININKVQPKHSVSTAGQRLQCSTQANGWRLHG